MKRVILCLSTLAVVAFAANNSSDNYYPEESNWDSYEVKVNWDEIEETADSIADKWETYEVYEKNYNKEQEKELKTALENAYKDTVGKIVMEWGDLIAPLVKHVGEPFDNKTMKGVCDAECAVKCWKAKKFDTVNSKWVYGFNTTCFRSCGCEFKLDKKMDKQTEKDFEKAADKIEDDIEDLVEYGEKVAKNARDNMIPALERYNNRTADLQNEYLKTVRNTAINDLGCNATCVNRCTNGYTTCFYEISNCLGHCVCDKLDEVIDLSHGRYNYASLMLYAKGSQGAIQAFYRNKDKF